jgi:hypothetical protein
VMYWTWTSWNEWIHEMLIWNCYYHHLKCRVFKKGKITCSFDQDSNLIMWQDNYIRNLNVDFIGLKNIVLWKIFNELSILYLMYGQQIMWHVQMCVDAALNKWRYYICNFFDFFKNVNNWKSCRESNDL